LIKIKMIEIDGSYGEGGGQILRTALGLSVVTKKPFKIYNIRKGRCKPGLKAQHLHSIKALLMLSDSKTSELIEGKEELVFYPGKFGVKNIKLDIGTAGSITLVMQALMLPLLLHTNKSFTITLSGGTDVKWSQPVDYFKYVLLNAISNISDISLNIIKRGYFPEGQGLVEFKFKQKNVFNNLDRKKINFIDRGKLLAIRGFSNASVNLQDKRVGEKQAYYAKNMLRKLGVNIDIKVEYSNTSSTGSALVLLAYFDGNYEPKPVLGTDGLGKMQKHSSDVAKEAVERLFAEINSGAPVDEYLADNLIPFIGVFGGNIRTSKISSHTKTNAYIAELFLDNKINIKGNTISAEQNVALIESIKRNR